MSRTVTAPGKLVVAGEYAVLEGFSGLVAAVDRRARCTVAGGARPTVEGMGRGPFAVVQEDGDVRLEGDDDDALGRARAVLAVAMARGLPLPAGAVRLDSSALTRADADGVSIKLGLGSSAAVAVALSGALLEAQGRPGGGLEARRAQVFDLAFGAHHRFSHGRGSGIDVAASTFGGLVQFQREGARARCEPAPPLPPDLAVVVAFTRRAQSTRELLARVETFKAAEPSTWHDVMEDLGRAAGLVRDGCRDRRATDVLAGVRRGREAMDALGRAAGCDIVSHPHREIADITDRCRGAAKPSGAGGGDVALCFVHTRDRERLEAELTAAGYPVVEVGLFAEGVRVEPS